MLGVRAVPAKPAASYLKGEEILNFQANERVNLGARAGSNYLHLTAVCISSEIWNLFEKKSHNTDYFCKMKMISQSSGLLIQENLFDWNVSFF